MKPKVTILMPVYNAEKYLKEAIDSVLNQFFTDFELLIIDDGSTDDSLKIIRSFHDSRIKIVIHKKNKKLIFTLNEGIKLSQGKYIVRMDSDDISMPNRLSEQVKFMDLNKQIIASGTWAEAIDKDGKYMFPMKSPIGILLKYNFWKPSPIIHPSVIIRRSGLKDLRFRKEAIDAEDYDLWLRINCNHKLANIKKYLLKYRIHQNSVSFKKRQSQLSSSYNSFKSVFGTNITFNEYKSLASLEFKLSPFKRLKLLKSLSNHIEYPIWFALIDTFVYSLKKWLKIGRYYET